MFVSNWWIRYFTWVSVMSVEFGTALVRQSPAGKPVPVEVPSEPDATQTSMCSPVPRSVYCFR
jgi:hypothetical protein